MLEKYIKKPHAILRMKHSNLGHILDDYATYLDQSRYSINSIKLYLSAIEHFGQWLSSYDTQIDKKSVDKFLKKHLPTCKCKRPASRDIRKLRAALHHLLRMLNKWHPQQDIQSCSPIDASIIKFDHYMKDICGLTEATRRHRRRNARNFLISVFNSRPLKFSYLTPHVIVDFINKQSRSLKKGSIGVLISSLHSYLKFLKFHGEMNDSLIYSLPRIHNWKLSTIPSYLSEDDIEKFLAAFDLTTSIGKRDYAAARCLTDLGFRCCEVAGLKLDDIHWREGSIEIAKSKNRRAILLPLPKMLAIALIDYIKNGRPETKERFIFVHHEAPVGKAATIEMIRSAIRRAYARAGFSPDLTGTHILRKTLATQLLQNGSTLKDIADILGHRCINTTMIYTKVDFPHLLQVALPWPRRMK